MGTSSVARQPSSEPVTERSDDMTIDWLLAALQSHCGQDKLDGYATVQSSSGGRQAGSPKSPSVVPPQAPAGLAGLQAPKNQPDSSQKRLPSETPTSEVSDGFGQSASRKRKDRTPEERVAAMKEKNNQAQNRYRQRQKALPAELTKQIEALQTKLSAVEKERDDSKKQAMLTGVQLNILQSQYLNSGTPTQTAMELQEIVGLAQEVLPAIPAMLSMLPTLEKLGSKLTLWLNSDQGK